jgi:hypothetical protein
MSAWIESHIYLPVRPSLDSKLSAALFQGSHADA